MAIELSKSELPYNTEVIYNGSEVFIIDETEKAFKLSYSKSVKRGTSMVSDHKEFSFWCPKSVWYNSKNFETSNDIVYFNAPYFLIKNI